MDCRNDVQTSGFDLSGWDGSQTGNAVSGGLRIYDNTNRTMIIVVNNSNRNKEVLNNLRKSKRMMEGSKKCMTKKNDNHDKSRFTFI